MLIIHQFSPQPNQNHLSYSMKLIYSLMNFLNLKTKVNYKILVLSVLQLLQTTTYQWLINPSLYHMIHHPLLSSNIYQLTIETTVNSGTFFHYILTPHSIFQKILYKKSSDLQPNQQLFLMDPYNYSQNKKNIQDNNHKFHFHYKQNLYYPYLIVLILTS